ncbi:uncharacterized protein FPRN_09661 [Fusarium proliferatum]|nr:uncharacterized protein FPRN_09661 [Fusarium proliferatum]
MVETITVGLTSWQASIATVTLLVAICNLAWTIHSKLEDWRIARDDKREKQQAEARNNASTAEKLASFEERIAELEKKLQKGLETVTKDAESVDRGRQKTLLRLNDNHARMNARLEELEKNKCKCNLTKSNDIDPLAAKITRSRARYYPWVVRVNVPASTPAKVPSLSEVVAALNAG